MDVRNHGGSISGFLTARRSFNVARRVGRNLDTLALMRFTRITVDSAVMGGLPCIRGLRVPVATVVTMVADGMSTDDILADLPYLERDDVSEALSFAAEAVRERQLPLTRPA